VAENDAGHGSSQYNSNLRGKVAKTTCISGRSAAEVTDEADHIFLNQTLGPTAPLWDKVVTRLGLKSFRLTHRWTFVRVARRMYSGPRGPPRQTRSQSQFNPNYAVQFNLSRSVVCVLPFAPDCEERRTTAATSQLAATFPAGEPRARNGRERQNRPVDFSGTESGHDLKLDSLAQRKNTNRRHWVFGNWDQQTRTVLGTDPLLKLTAENLYVDRRTHSNDGEQKEWTAKRNRPIRGNKEKLKRPSPHRRMT
jgi:hypothetical protein